MLKLLFPFRSLCLENIEGRGWGLLASAIQPHPGREIILILLYSSASSLNKYILNQKPQPLSPKPSNALTTVHLEHSVPHKEETHRSSRRFIWVETYKATVQYISDTDAPD